MFKRTGSISSEGEAGREGDDLLPATHEDAALTGPGKSAILGLQRRDLLRSLPGDGTLTELVPLHRVQALHLVKLVEGGGLAVDATVKRDEGPIRYTYPESL